MEDTPDLFPPSWPSPGREKEPKLVASQPKNRNLTLSCDKWAERAPATLRELGNDRCVLV